MQLALPTFDFALPTVKVVISWIGERWSLRLKRTIFVFSVMAAIDRTHGTDDKTIVQVNRQLRLASCDRLCKDSARARDAIWGQAAKGSDVINDVDALSVATSDLERKMIALYYIKNCPAWLSYSAPLMRRDILRLFNAIVTREAD